jgi:hypothetical protein
MALRHMHAGEKGDGAGDVVDIVLDGHALGPCWRAAGLAADPWKIVPGACSRMEEGADCRAVFAPVSAS